MTSRPQSLNLGMGNDKADAGRHRRTFLARPMTYEAAQSGTGKLIFLYWTDWQTIPVG